MRNLELKAQILTACGGSATMQALLGAESGSWAELEVVHLRALENP